MAKENTLKRRWEKEDQAAVANTIEALQKHRDGRKFLWWLLQIGEVGTQPYAPNALQMSFNCGSLNVGNKILEAVTQTSPEGYIKMMKENADEQRTRDDALTDARAGSRDTDDTD